MEQSFHAAVIVPFVSPFIPGIGSTLEALASQAPSWIRTRAGKERVAAAEKLLQPPTASSAGSGSSPSSDESRGGMLMSARGRGAGGAGRQSARGQLVNESQQRAARVALGRTVTLWQVWTPFINAS